MNTLRIRGQVYENEPAVIRAELVDQGLLPVTRADVEFVSVYLYRKGGEADEPLHEWHPSYQDVVEDVPVTHVSDPGWAPRERGYNFRFEVPAWAFERGPGGYTCEVRLRMRNRRVAHVVADIDVLRLLSERGR